MFYLKKIIESVSEEQISSDWTQFDFVKFSNDKSLYDFQQEALKNAIKALWLFYSEKNGDKAELYETYKNYELTDIEEREFAREDSRVSKILADYYEIRNGVISFDNFINRMCFWMATGSGKTLVIIKLIEILNRLIHTKLVPVKDILFLTYRDDLIEQFIKHVDEFNMFSNDTKIEIKSLKDYDQVKNDNKLGFYDNTITVFYYRSDLINDERSEKYVDFKDYGENGDWYIFLDEAHKGETDDSKRKGYYSIMCRNGFMFNFSATFTDLRDYATCAFEINLATFIEKGYGKHLYVSTQNLEALRQQTDFSDVDKQKIFLKTLILLTCLNKHSLMVKGINDELYHKPLLLALVNTVNVEDSDLQMVFNQIEKIGNGDLEKEIFKESKSELVTEYNHDIEFEFNEDTFSFDTSYIEKIDEKDLLRNIFNTENYGAMEVLKIPGNEKELIFKLKTADKPFMLSKTGDIYKLIKEKFANYEINESFDNESEFKRINDDDSDIRILTGSRAFYEGWDSNRPNVIIYINIGVGTRGRKFVLQSIGRGVRIEPFKHERKRISSIFLDAQKAEIKRQISDSIKPLETLFIYGTKAENLNQILATLREEKQETEIGTEFLINEEVNNKLLLIPICKHSEELLIDKRKIRYSISDGDYDTTKSYYDYLGDKITLMKYETEVKILNRANEGLNGKKTDYFQIAAERTLNKPEVTLKRIFDFISLKNRELDKFKRLDEEIIHFRKVRVDNTKKDQVIRMIREVLEYTVKEEVLKNAKKGFEEHGNIDLFTHQVQEIEAKYKPARTFENLSFQYIQNHYYLPVILSDDEKIKYINHIIKVTGEVKFIKDLEKYIIKNGGIFKNYDWWLFSKIDETTDNVSIPYYNPIKNAVASYNPDFIIWLKKDKKYIILFLDPKGTAHTSYEHKVDGYEMLFKDKTFGFEDLEIEVKLLLRPIDINTTSEKYKEYWFQDIEEIEQKINQSININ